MGKFLTKLRTEKISEKDSVLLDPLQYQKGDKVYEAPRGFITDFGSVPRVPIAYWLCGGVGDAECVLHDFGYRTGSMSKKEADELLLDALLSNPEVPDWKAYAMYSMVVLFGGPSYKGRSTEGEKYHELPVEP